MSQNLIDRYQSGGNIYAAIAAAHGVGAADAVAAAALSGDEHQINAVYDTYMTAAGNAVSPSPLADTSILNALGNQLATDPFGAPLSSLNNVLTNTIKSLFSNPAVLIVGAIVLFFFVFDGADLIRRKMKG